MLVDKFIDIICVFIINLGFIKILDNVEKIEGKKSNIDKIFLLTILFEMLLYGLYDPRDFSYVYYIYNALFIITFILFAKFKYKISYLKAVLYFYVYITVCELISIFSMLFIYICATGRSVYEVSVGSEISSNLCLIRKIITTLIIIVLSIISKKIRTVENQNKVAVVLCILGQLVIIIIENLTNILNVFNINIFLTANALSHSVYPKIYALNFILLLIIFLRLRDYIEQKKQESILKEKIDMQYSYYLNLQESQHKVRRIYHDVNNHMICIKNMINNKDDVNKYIDSITNELESFKETYNSGNIILDIILNEKKSLCKKDKIELNCDINFSKCGFIEMIDVCSIFSNIIDNAIEACYIIDKNKKYINIRGAIVKSYYVIICENSKINKVNIKNNIIITSKRNKFNHGLGIKSVRASLKKYNGSLEIEDFNDKFVLKIYIPIV